MTPTLNIFIDGFAQPDRISHGFVTAEERIRAGNVAAAVLIVNWNDNFRDLVEFIMNHGGWPLHVAAHSFGADASCKRLFPELARLGRRIDNASFADPVSKPPRLQSLTVPSNVLRLHSWKKKRKGIIRAATLIVQPPTEYVTKLVVKGGHASVDEAKSFLDHVVRLGLEGK